MGWPWRRRRDVRPAALARGRHMRVESTGDVEPTPAAPANAAPRNAAPMNAGLTTAAPANAAPMNAAPMNAGLTTAAPALVAAPVVSVADPGTAPSAETPLPPAPAPTLPPAPAADAAPIVSLVFADGESVALAEDDPRVGSFRAAAAAMLGDAPATGPS